jgi:hypothetical protein
LSPLACSLNPQSPIPRTSARAAHVINLDCAFRRATIKPPVSDRKRRANRANAKKSTGPRTSEGKRRSSRNAVKHGLLSDHLVITAGPERPEDFRALLADLQGELRPKTAIERALVERIASCLWRLRRAQRFEAGAISESLDQCSRADTKVSESLAKLQARLDRATSRLQCRRDELESIQHLTGLDDPDTAANVHAHLTSIASSVSPLAAGLPTPQLHEFLLTKLTQSIEDLDAEIPRISAQIREIADREKHRLDRSPLTGSLPAPQEVLKLVRYENMLDRHLHRALAKLTRRRRSEPHADSPQLDAPQGKTK